MHMSLVWVSQVQVECFIFLCCGRWYRQKGWDILYGTNCHLAFLFLPEDVEMPEDGPQKKLGKKALQKLNKQRKLKRLKHKKQKNKKLFKWWYWKKRKMRWCWKAKRTNFPNDILVTCLVGKWKLHFKFKVQGHWKIPWCYETKN